MGKFIVSASMFVVLFVAAQGVSCIIAHSMGENMARIILSWGITLLIVTHPAITKKRG